MRRLPGGYSISGAAAAEIPALIAIDLAAGQLFAGTGMLPDEALDDHVPADILEEAIPGGHLAVVRDRDGVPAGFVMTSPRPGMLYLDQISVHPAHGRRGLGAALVKWVVKDARRRGRRSVTLSTFRKVPWNGPFYRKLGFRELPRKRMAFWMLEIESLQAEKGLDVTQRCFMQRKVGWL
jgi:4-diphosphocytidyl-2-C-methyl-D-erythritol kinase